MMKKTLTMLAMLTSMCSSHAWANSQPIEPVLVPLKDKQQNINVQIGKYEVTVAEFTRFAKATNFKIDSECHLYNEKHTPEKKHGTWNNPDLTKAPYRPVVCLGAKDAMSYAAWLAKETGKPYRLATFNEWQLASVTRKNSRFDFGDDLQHNNICDYENVDDFAHNAGLKQHHGYRNRYGANCNDGATYHTVVGMYRPNTLGLHDIMGNVREITKTCLENNHKSTKSCEKYIIAGGSWHWLPNPKLLKNPMIFAGSIEGFRLVLDSEKPQRISEQTQSFIDGLAKAQQHALISHKRLKSLPNKVEGIIANIIDKQQVKVSWMPSNAKAVSYKLYRSYLDESGNLSRSMTKIAENITATEYIDKLPGNGAVSYQIFANNDIGESQPSKEVFIRQNQTFKIGQTIQAELYQSYYKAEVIKNEKSDTVLLSSNDGHYPPDMVTYDPAWLSYQFDSQLSDAAMLTMNIRGQDGAVVEFWQGKDLIAKVTLDDAREFNELSVAAQLNTGLEPIKIRSADDKYVILDWFKLHLP
jgi:hypothetical protein